MKCISEIHQIPGQPGKNRMDLHCFNRENNDGRNPNRCGASCHMGVITEDPKEWICHEYNFSFNYNGKTYYMYGFDNLVDPYHQRRGLGNKTGIIGMVNLNYFIPISTGDNMHEEAWELFHRLKKLVIFS
jgi:hypothetical protein